MTEVGHNLPADVYEIANKLHTPSCGMATKVSYCFSISNTEGLEITKTAVLCSAIKLYILDAEAHLQGVNNVNHAVSFR